ncbi:hypothetical protein Q7P35_000894 [Cladosporium inversicolor]
MTTILTLEQCIDNCSALFVKRMGEFADSGAVVDLGTWLQWCAFDVVGELFLGQQFGFMENSHDHESCIASLDALLPGMMAASLVPPAFRNLVLGTSTFNSTVRKGLKAVKHISAAARGCVAKRADADAKSESQADRTDLLQHLLSIVKNKDESDLYADGQLCNFAGSDTTAIALRSVFYHLMRNPEVHAELLAEIDEATSPGKLSSPPRFREASDLPFLCATIKQAMRLHPSVGLTMPRVAPVGGLEISGTYVPAGCDIGMNAAVVGYNEEILGPDVYEFQPKRWLGENAATLEKHNLIFGAGTRTCIGKNLSIA